MFFVIWGTKLFGRADEVPGLGHVATNCFHIYGLPLFPVQSYFVVDEGWDRCAGIPIQSSSCNKSRFAVFAPPIALFVAGMFMLFGLAVASGLKDERLLLPCVAVAFLLAASLLAYVFRTIKRNQLADYETACEFGKFFDDERIQIYIHHHFKKIGDEEADQLIATLNRTKYSNEGKGFGEASRGIDYPGRAVVAEYA